jgi:hypothetical protein
MIKPYRDTIATAWGSSSNPGAILISECVAAGRDTPTRTSSCGCGTRSGIFARAVATGFAAWFNFARSPVETLGARRVPCHRCGRQLAHRQETRRSLSQHRDQARLAHYNIRFPCGQKIRTVGEPVGRSGIGKLTGRESWDNGSQRSSTASRSPDRRGGVRVHD